MFQSIPKPHKMKTETQTSTDRIIVFLSIQYIFNSNSRWKFCFLQTDRTSQKQTATIQVQWLIRNVTENPQSSSHDVCYKDAGTVLKDHGSRHTVTAKGATHTSKNTHQRGQTLLPCSTDSSSLQHIWLMEQAAMNLHHAFHRAMNEAMTAEWQRSSRGDAVDQELGGGCRTGWVGRWLLQSQPRLSTHTLRLLWLKHTFRLWFLSHWQRQR